MKKYYLKPGSYSDSTKLSSSNPPGLNLENYIVSVINNPTCCTKQLISSETTSPQNIVNIWAGTQLEYDALGTYDATTLYFIV